ncbi:MAG: SDR family oxidoreductase [Patulibacter sp.]|nr:SDR family oxidoreductase [Patulibacter sp.]
MAHGQQGTGQARIASSAPRTVVVSGAAGGVGRHCCARFLAAGDRVVALGRTLAALEALRDELTADRLEIRSCDVGDEDAVRATFAALGGTPDVLVNNAGIARSAALGRTTLADWDEHLRVNATGPFLCTREVLDGMRERGSGAIVTVASTVGRVGSPYTAAYAASKHAAVGLTRVAAAELAGSGATANAVCPTFIDTPMTAASVERIVGRTGRDADDARQALGRQSPLGRLLDPDEVAASVLWLASPDARAISGQTVVLDGGGLQS